MGAASPTPARGACEEPPSAGKQQQRQDQQQHQHQQFPESEQPAAAEHALSAVLLRSDLAHPITEAIRSSGIAPATGDGTVEKSTQSSVSCHGFTTGQVDNRAFAD